MKTFVKVKNSIRHHEYIKVGATGYISGYVRGGDNSPYAIVVIEKELVMAGIYDLEVIEENK